MNNNNKVSRRKFLQICGSVIAGGTIFGLGGVFLHRRITNPQGVLSGAVGKPKVDTFRSPYKLVSSFRIPDHIQAFELADEQLIVAAPNNIYIYDATGSLMKNFAIGSNLRDIATADDRIYLLFGTRIEVYDRNGEWVNEWEACSDQSDYCSMTVSPKAVFVTDAANKNVCKYTTEGNFERFIESPDGFIIPSYSFGITYTDGVLYCSNPGRHKVEKYTADGEYLGSFGQAGGATGMFCGCCNPVHLAYTDTGEIITSEKGNPRISCYSPDGEFRSMLLDSKALGGGNKAYDIKVKNDKLFVAGGDIVSTFRYDRTLAARTACADCKVNCPLRQGINI